MHPPPHPGAYVLPICMWRGVSADAYCPRGSVCAGTGGGAGRGGARGGRVQCRAAGGGAEPAAIRAPD